MGGRPWLVDKLLLIGWSLLVIIVGTGFSIVFGRYKVNPGWWAIGVLTLGFALSVGWDSRAHWQSTGFLVFLFGWMVVYLASMVLAIAYLSWVYWILVLFAVLFIGNIAKLRLFTRPPGPRSPS